MNEPQVRGCSVCSAVRTTNASLQRMVAQLERDRVQLTAERDEAREELADRKVIDRAKGILMARGQLTEHEAYHRMRRAAMQHGQKLVNVARAVLAEAASAPDAERLLEREEAAARIGELADRIEASRQPQVVGGIVAQLAAAEG